MPHRATSRFTRAQWAGIVVVGAAGAVVVAAMTVLLARWVVSIGPVREFIDAHPGSYAPPPGAPAGIPAWLAWQHFFNAFLIVLVIRSGLQVRREKRPAAFWSPRGDHKRRMSLTRWFHESLDVLWIANGVVYVVLLFVTGQWMRIVPTSWDVLPNALSALLQYASLNWPTGHGWVHYNALQQLAYFAAVFVAAPLAILTGVRMSWLWPRGVPALDRAFPFERARGLHVLVMLFFVVFIVVHVALVLATGALRNLDRMYAAQDTVSWTGFWLFVASLVVTAAACAAARPRVLVPIARLFGSVKER